MRHANRKPKAGQNVLESAARLAQSHGHCSVNGKGCVMRRTLPRVALALAMAVAGLLTCDSGCIANAEEGRAPQSPVRDEPRPNRQPVDHVYPPPPRDEQRAPRRGDFWTPAEFDNVLPEDGRRHGFETIVPAR